MVFQGEHHQMLCHDWLSSKHVVMGTKTGKALLLEDAELRTTVDVWAKIQEVQPEVAAAAAAAQLPQIAASGGQIQMNVPSGVRSSTSSFPGGGGGGGGGSSSSSVVNEERFVHSVLAFKAGFVCSVGGSAAAGGGGFVSGSGGGGGGGGGLSVGRVAVFKLDKSLKETKPDDDINFSGNLVQWNMSYVLCMYIRESLIELFAVSTIIRLPRPSGTTSFKVNKLNWDIRTILV